MLGHHTELSIWIGCVVIKLQFPISLKRSDNLCIQCCLTLIKVIPLGGSHQGKSDLMATYLSLGKGGEMWPQSKTCNVIKSYVFVSGCCN